MEPVERVLVVRRADFFDGAWPQGFVAVDPGEGESFLSRIWRQGFFVDRPAAEANPAWKQPIPYCAILRGEEVFCVDVSPTCMDSQGALPEVAVRETRKMRGGFTRLAALEPLWQDPTRFESWSRLILAAGILLRGDRSSTFHRR